MRAADGASRLKARLAVLRDRVGVDVGRVSSLLAVERRMPEIRALLGDLDRQLERVERAAVITLVGPTGAGKSTLLNALAGQEIAQEGVDRPTTRRAVVYAPNDADLGELVAAGAGPDAPLVVRHALKDGFAGQVLVDAPDMNSIDERNHAIVRALAERSDVLVVVLHRQAVIETASVSFIDEFAERRRLIFVLNRIDELTEAARDALLAQVRELAISRWGESAPPIVALSARRVRELAAAGTADGIADRTDDGWSTFTGLLRSFVGESILGVRRVNALGTAAELAAVFGATWAEARADFDQLPEDVARGLSELERRSAEEVESRLRLRRADLCRVLWSETAKRWDGPGGFALAAGSLTSLGLGAAALLARRNPLVAAGAAVSGLAVDQAQQGMLDSRLADTGALAPSSGELAVWASDALGPARVRAARLAGTPDAFAVPSSELVHSRIVAALGEAWSNLLERDLPGLAERSWLRFFRLLLDLPVYGLVAWVVVKVAEGYWREAYLGFDFLSNSLLLLLAYLFVVRVVVRRVLGLRIGALLGQVGSGAREALAREGMAARARVDASLTKCVSALKSLADLPGGWRAGLDGG